MRKIDGDEVGAQVVLIVKTRKGRCHHGEENENATPDLKAKLY